MRTSMNGSSSDEEGGDTSMSSSSCSSSQSSFCPALGPAPSLEPKTIPTVSNPNSVYQSQFSEFASVPSQPAQLIPRGRPFLGMATLRTAPHLEALSSSSSSTPSSCLLNHSSYCDC
ncbi:hypothetical protein DPEC_G00238120 [Dallia pectoralis]|uniref:Uncharacterized protein n=1 Tax=Dallia pectoralis TaxID=75939 RepID=A0ACC2FZ41_DALPE|nr:hypothetical protein DPEC_G00238120 [Dallia pectoralis]